LYVVAHNLPFDFRIVKGFAEMTVRGLIQEKLIFEGTTNIFSFRLKDKKLVFIDNMNFFKVPLEVLGNNVGLKKLNIQSDDLKIYCKRDVEIMVKAWELYMDFLKKGNLGNFAMTIAGQAFNAFRHRFMFSQIYIHNNAEIIKDERNAYHGGRTECFRIGNFKGKFYMYDFNSMYPSVMKNLEYPTRYISTIYGTFTKRELKNLLKDYCLIADCIVKTNNPIFPTKENNKLIFPVGTFNTVLSTREIEYAINNNLLVKIRKVNLYKKAKLFSNYVDFFFERKQYYKENNNESFSYLCKLFLNSLYGKFGQRNKFYEPVNLKLPDGHYFDTVNFITYRTINGRTEKLVGLREGIDSFVAIPAHITADARMKLWELIERAGLSHAYYCDTDSLITDRKLKTSKELGEISLKGESDEISIYGNKDYIFNGDEVIKGISKKAVRLSNNSFSQVQFEGMAGAIRNNRLNSVVIRQIVKKLNRKYDKGIIKGTKINPFTLNRV